MNKKVIIGIALVIILIVIIILCIVLNNNNKSNDNNNVDSEISNYLNNKSSKKEDNSFMSLVKNVSSNEALENAEKQMAEPDEGETIAIMHIKDYGDITIKFFNDVAPKAVENFITHSKDGYYNGITFHRVISDFMIQGGDPEGTGAGGQSIWGTDFDEELSEKVLPYRGALCMASRGTGTTSLGSQFFIVQANYKSSMTSSLSNYGLSNFTESYKKYGGDLVDLVGYAQYTTFGQVISGMDIVDKIASVKTDTNDKPLEDVIISSIEILTYSKSLRKK